MDQCLPWHRNYLACNTKQKRYPSHCSQQTNKRAKLLFLFFLSSWYCFVLCCKKNKNVRFQRIQWNMDLVPKITKLHSKCNWYLKPAGTGCCQVKRHSSTAETRPIKFRNNFRGDDNEHKTLTLFKHGGYLHGSCSFSQLKVSVCVCEMIVKFSFVWQTESSPKEYV